MYEWKQKKTKIDAETSPVLKIKLIQHMKRFSKLQICGQWIGR